MADALDGQGQIEAADEERLRTTAQTLGATVLSTTTLAAAQAAIRSVQKNEGRGVIAEPAEDLRRLRTNPELMQALAKDLKIARDQSFILIGDALWLGYRLGLTGRAALLESEHLSVVVNLTEEDRLELTGYVILGHTILEVVDLLMARLLYEVNGALALPLTGVIDPAAIPASLAAVGQAHGVRLGGAVGEAHAAGVQAAVRMIGSVLLGVA